MRQLVTLAVRTGLVAAVAAVAAARTVPAQGTEQAGPRPEPKTDCVNEPYWGTVTGVTKNSITIQFGNEKPKTFAVSKTLAAGKVPAEPRPTPDNPHGYRVFPTEMYRLADVKVGDWVLIKYAHMGDANICDHICIQKRPGGRVPPLPEEAEALRMAKPPAPGAPPDPSHIRYDELMNARWDLEDKGIPYPEKFVGRARRFPVAPMPREVNRGPAVAP